MLKLKINDLTRRQKMKTKLITLMVALSSVFIVACSTFPGKISGKDLGIPDVAACKVNQSNIACEAGLGG
jgi:predicted small secreted protein